MLEGFAATLIEQDATQIHIHHRMARWQGADLALLAATRACRAI